MTLYWIMVTTFMDLHIPTEQKAWTDFLSYRSDLFNLINTTEAGRTLGRTAGVRNAIMSAQDRPRYIPVNRGATDGAVGFIAQTMIVIVTYKVNRT
jgi:hypothetical protein